MTFGQYNPYSSENPKKRFYLQEGSNIYRVLPPAHSLASVGKISQFWSIIWLTAPNGKKYPVPSILKKGKDGTILERDPLIDKIEQINEQLKKAVAMGDTHAINELKELQKKIFNKKFYAVNAMNQSGEVGVLSIPYTAYQSFKTKLKELYDNGIDAIGIGADKGLFFDFKRSRDERGRTMYSVEVATKVIKTDAGPSAMYIRAPITEEEAKSLANQVEDLTKLYKSISSSEMSLLTSLSQEAFDAVFGRGSDGEKVEEDEETQENVNAVVRSKTLQTGSLKNTTAPVNNVTSQNLTSTKDTLRPVRSEPTSTVTVDPYELVFGSR